MARINYLKEQIARTERLAQSCPRSSSSRAPRMRTAAKRWKGMPRVTSNDRAAPSRAHLYCCGPVTMLEAFEAATRDRPTEQVHVEYFKAKEKPASEGGFDVRLARSNRTIKVEQEA